MILFADRGQTFQSECASGYPFDVELAIARLAQGISNDFRVQGVGLNQENIFRHILCPAQISHVRISARSFSLGLYAAALIRIPNSLTLANWRPIYPIDLKG